MERAWTDNQLRAIEARDPDILVAAGAGSGKTGVLVERFVRLVTSEGVGVDRILVITFTERATKEMKARIVAELNRRRLTRERRQIESSYISTIHGLCSRLLQENPFEAGVDPEFAVLDETQARRTLRSAFEAALARGHVDEDRPLADLIAAAQTVGPTRAGSDSIQALYGSVEAIVHKLRGAGRRFEEVERLYLEGVNATALRSLGPINMVLAPIVDETRACLDALPRLRDGALGAVAMSIDALLDGTTSLTRDEVNIATVIEALNAAKTLAERVKPRMMNASEREIEISNVIERIRLACREAGDLLTATAEKETEANARCHAVLRLVVESWRGYERVKRERGALDSDDLQLKAVELLERSEATRERYRERFRHMMVDEFQDTNGLQMRLIELLRRSQDPPNGLFVVGDAQQSIYGFRNAEPALFQGMERRFREGGGGLHVPLTVNFRSRPELLTLVSRIFGGVWRTGPTRFAQLTSGARFDAARAPCVDILLTENLFRREYVRVEADALAGYVRALVEGREVRITALDDPRHGEPIRYSDVAILLRSLFDIEKYEQAFAARGVPYFVAGGGRGYYARREVRDLIAVLTLITSPLDDVAFAATLRSPFVGADVDTLLRLARYTGRQNGRDSDRTSIQSLSEAVVPLLESGELPTDEAERLATFMSLIERLRADEDRLPAARLLERLIAETNYDARLLCRPGGRRRLANVRKLLQIANNESVHGLRELIQRLRELKTVSDREGDAPIEEEAADVTRFITIHGAKGLEFPVVIVADLSRGLLMPEKSLFVCDPRSVAIGTVLGGEPSLAYRAIDRRRLAADTEESNRLLYVALTRAKERLTLCGNLGRSKSVNWADNLFPQLGILEAPNRPTVTQLALGVSATLAPLTHYVAASELGAADRPDDRADAMALDILKGTG